MPTLSRNVKPNVRVGIKMVKGIHGQKMKSLVCEAGDEAEHH